MCQGFSNISVFFHKFVLAIFIATSSIKVKTIISSEIYTVVKSQSIQNAYQCCCFANMRNTFVDRSSVTHLVKKSIQCDYLSIEIKVSHAVINGSFMVMVAI